MRTRKEIEILIDSTCHGFVDPKVQQELFNLLFEILERLPKTIVKQEPLSKELIKEMNKFNGDGS